MSKQKKSFKEQGFHDCEKVSLKRDAQGNVLKVDEVIREPNALPQEAIDTFNEQQNNSGFALLKKGFDYEIHDCKVATGKGGVNITRKMLVEVGEKKVAKKAAKVETQEKEETPE
jgi:hypothetical protein